MEKKSIKEQLEAIVNAEIEELKKVLDEWFKADEDRTTLKFSDKPNEMPYLNLYSAAENYTWHYVVKNIEVCHEGYYLTINRWDDAYNDEISDDNSSWLYLDRDDDREMLIPGELTRLTEIVRKAVNPAITVYELDAKQKLAITMFKSALEELKKQNVGLLHSNDYDYILFYNHTNESYITSDDASEGMEIDDDKLEQVYLGAFNYNADMDSLYAAK